MKAVTIRMPEELLDWLREKAARETIRRKKTVSINTIVVETLSRTMRLDTQKGYE